MSKPRHLWYGYMKNAAKAYPARRKRESKPGAPPLTSGERREIEAVEYAIELTARKKDGKERIKIIELALFKGKDLNTAASRCYISYSTARAWQSEFLTTMAEYMGIL